MDFKMKIFVSWSGNRSRAVAEIISDWLKCVIQASQPWISTRDIDRGAIWSTEINDKLKDVSVGIVCLTQDNKNKPWILFETGALAKGLTSNRVCTFLIDLKSEDIQEPLAQFNHTTPDKSSVWALTRTINTCLDSSALDERILQQVFDTYWPQFEQNFGAALIDNPPEEIIPPRTEQDILNEILNHTRGLSSRVRNLESELKFKSEINSNLSPVNKIHNMLDSGKYSPEMIIEDLVGLGIKEDYASELVLDSLDQYKNKEKIKFGSKFKKSFNG